MKLEANIIPIYYTDIEKNTSASNRKLMKFLYVESQKHTRNEISWAIGTAEAGIKSNHVALHFDIHKTTAYRIGSG